MKTKSILYLIMGLFVTFAIYKAVTLRANNSETATLPEESNDAPTSIPNVPEIPDGKPSNYQKIIRIGHHPYAV